MLRRLYKRLFPDRIEWRRSSPFFVGDIRHFLPVDCWTTEDKSRYVNGYCDRTVSIPASDIVGRGCDLAAI